MTIPELPAAPIPIPRGSLYALDTSDLRRSYVLDCNSGVQIRLSELAHRVLTGTWSGASFDDIAIACSDAERSLTADDIRRLHDHVIARVDLAEQRSRTRWSDCGLLLRFTLIPPALAGRIAAPFAALFQPRVAVPATLVIVCAVAYWIAAQSLAWPDGTVSAILAGYGLFLASCLAHELGHAGACIRFGVRPGSIGLALYLVFPVFYSDVTRIWRLNRRQRVAVDVAGLYVQCLCAAAYLLIYVQTHAAACFIAINLIAAAALLDLNPLFRFDGYWIVSDALGISDLYPQVDLTFRRLVQRLAGFKDAAAPGWPNSTVAALSLYSFVALGGWVWFASGLVARAVGQGRWAFAVLPAMAKHGQLLSFALAARLSTLLAGGFALAYCIITLLRFIRRTVSDSDDAGARVGR